MAFVKLTGNIGCMVNGAGLAMATMDAIALYGAGEGAFRQDPRCRRRRHRREGHHRLQDHPQGPRGRGHPGQHLRRHHEVRHHRHRRAHRGARGRPRPAAGGAPRGHQRRPGQEAIAESGLPEIAADDLKDGCVKAAQAANDYRRTRGLAPTPCGPSRLRSPSSPGARARPGQQQSRPSAGRKQAGQAHGREQAGQAPAASKPAKRTAASKPAKRTTPAAGGRRGTGR